MKRRADQDSTTDADSFIYNGKNGYGDIGEEESNDSYNVVDEDEDSISMFNEDVDEDSNMGNSRIEVPEISMSFTELCEVLDASLSPSTVKSSWQLYYRMTQQVLLEGEQSSWMAVALYYHLLTKGIKMSGKEGKTLNPPFPFTLGKILESFDMSAIEFFDKITRFIDCSEVQFSHKTRRINDYIRKIQEGLAVSAVVFKKFLRIYRRMFNLIDETTAQQEDVPSTKQLFTLIWTTYLVMKRNLGTDELLHSFHLLLCIVDAIYSDMCKQEIEPHINQDFAIKLIEGNRTVLEALCDEFDGSVLDAKHFREHTYEKKKELMCIPSSWNIKENVGQLQDRFHKSYDIWLLHRAQVDERIFIPEDISRVFDDAFDASAVEMLRRGPDNKVFDDANLLLKMSTQSCIDKGLDSESAHPLKPTASKGFRIGNEPMCTLTPVSAALENTNKLSQLLSIWNLQTSELKKLCESMSDSPLPSILLAGEVMKDKFSQKVREESLQNIVDDEVFTTDIAKHTQTAYNLYLVFIEQVILSETGRKSPEEALLSVLRREDFLYSVFCFALEVILFAYGSSRKFPWSAKVCEVHPYTFHKIMHIFAAAQEQNLSRQTVVHLNQVEEQILEEHAWAYDSPLWKILERVPVDSLDPFDETWFDKGWVPLDFAPQRKRRFDGLNSNDEPKEVPKGTIRNVYQFTKRVYLLTAIRMNELCDRLRLQDNRSRAMVWTLFDFILRGRTTLLKGRHLDSNIMCCIYVISRIRHLETSFKEIMAQYRRLPQAHSRVYRMVPIEVQQISSTSSEDGSSRDSSSSLPRRSQLPTPGLTSAPPTPELAGIVAGVEYVDLIKYYNDVFRIKVEDFATMMDTDSEELPYVLMSMPVPKLGSFSPVKRTLSSKVLVQTMASNMSPNFAARQQDGPDILLGDTHRPHIMTYSFQSSPRKELRRINQTLSRAGTPHTKNGIHTIGKC